VSFELSSHVLEEVIAGFVVASANWHDVAVHISRRVGMEGHSLDPRLSLLAVLPSLRQRRWLRPCTPTHSSRSQ
jgi:hypothetical protein